ncbi:MAG: hypothetical protein HY017_22675 [Betaproteobacteria bacterium]|nr:hypothetical protein [Betaproteobacteria bacterium]
MQELEGPRQARASELDASRKAPLPAADRAVLTLIFIVISGLLAWGAIDTLIPLLAERDSISESQARDRAKAFVAATPLQLQRVAVAEIPQALASMKLSPSDRSLLEAVVAETSAESQVQRGPQTGTDNDPAAASARDPQAPRPAPLPKASTKPAIRLAWITLWDTDAEDGDTVRIDSSGFSSVVTLANTPVTFAVPVPDQGVINVTGVHDGGGGITIGAMSGARRVALPVMSLGQVLGIPVVAR